MALEVVYEGVPAGEKNVLAAELTSANYPMTAGTIVCLSATAGAITTGYALDSAVDVPLGLLADDKSDIIASGKASVYFTPGLYKTDQVLTAATLVKGSLVTFNAAGKLCLTSEFAGNNYIVGICTEAAGSDGMVELFLNISGYVKA